MAIDDASLIRVRGTASVPQLASAVSHRIYDGQPAVMRAIGAGAVSQAVKAGAVARGYVAPRGLDLALIPGFDTVVMDDGEITAITLRIHVMR